MKIEKIEFFRSLLKCVVFDDCIDNALNFLWIERFWKILLKRMTSNIKFNRFVNDNIYQSLYDFVKKLIEHIARKSWQFRIEKMFVNVFFRDNIERITKSACCFRFFRFRRAKSINETISNKRTRNAVKWQKRFDDIFENTQIFSKFNTIDDSINYVNWFYWSEAISIDWFCRNKKRIEFSKLWLFENDEFDDFQRVKCDDNFVVNKSTVNEVFKLKNE